MINYFVPNPPGGWGVRQSLTKPAILRKFLTKGEKIRVKGFIRELLTKASAAGAIFLVLPTPKTIFVKDFRLTKGT